MASAITPAPTSIATCMSRRASRRALMRPPSPRPAAHAPPRSLPVARGLPSSSSATWPAGARWSRPTGPSGAAHPQRRQALLALRPQVSRLADRLGIVAARAHRIACAARRSPISRAARGPQLQACPLEVPQRPMAPDVGRPPSPPLPRPPWRPWPPGRRLDGRRPPQRRGMEPPALNAATQPAAPARKGMRRVADHRSGAGRERPCAESGLAALTQRTGDAVAPEAPSVSWRA